MSSQIIEVGVFLVCVTILSILCLSGCDINMGVKKYVYDFALNLSAASFITFLIERAIGCRNARIEKDREKACLIQFDQVARYVIRQYCNLQIELTSSRLDQMLGNRSPLLTARAGVDELHHDIKFEDMSRMFENSICFMTASMSMPIVDQFLNVEVKLKNLFFDFISVNRLQHYAHVASAMQKFITGNRCVDVRGSIGDLRKMGDGKNNIAALVVKGMKDGSTQKYYEENVIKSGSVLTANVNLPIVFLRESIEVQRTALVEYEDAMDLIRLEGCSR